MSDALAPDAGEALRAWLGSVTAVTAVVGSRIGLSLTGPDPAIRYAQLGPGTNIGGGAVSARYQVECWGAGNGAVDDGTANLLARRIMSAVPDWHGMMGAVRVSGAAAGYPYPEPDRATGRPRWIVEVEFVAAAAA